MTRIFEPTKEEIENTAAAFGYPQPGRYALMVLNGEIQGMEREKEGRFEMQCSRLPKSYPSDAELVVANLDESGRFTEL